MFHNKPRLVLFIAIIAFIWLHSLIPSDISTSESNWFADSIVNPILSRLGFSALSVIVVRKIAHVIEFMCLGIISALICGGKFVPSLMIGLIVAFLDETIQIFSGRGSLISDVWIDLSGVAIGNVLMWFFIKNKS